MPHRPDFCMRNASVDGKVRSPAFYLNEVEEIDGRAQYDVLPLNQLLFQCMHAHNTMRHT